MTFGLIYLAGYLWFWRYFVGFIAQDFAGTNYRTGLPNKLEGEDMIAGLFFGSMACLVYPAVVPGYFLRRQWHRGEWSETGAINNIFPGPKPIETKSEKQERLAREEREKIATRRKEINAAELRAGIEPTIWSK